MADLPTVVTALDRALLLLAPGWARSRVKARLDVFAMEEAARHFEAASAGRRTMGWPKRFSDANVAAAPALATLRAHSRELVRNNGWARNARRVIKRNVVGWGITPKPVAATNAKALMEAWNLWAGSTQCDAAERQTLAGLQGLAMNTIFESGEVLIRRRWRQPRDELALPFALQVLEPDHIDTAKHDVPGQQGGMVFYGIEFDALGRRVAYWLFPEHPGSSRFTQPQSKRVDARDVIHAFDLERAGQDRGIPWLCAAIVKMKDLDEFEDGALQRQKIAALLGGFIETPDGTPIQLGAAGQDPKRPTTPVQVIEPAMVQKLRPGEKVVFSNPPVTTDERFSIRTLQSLAAAIGVTYEELSGDYSQFNFSSSRASRIAHWGNVHDWQWNMLIPQVCDPIWSWGMQAAAMIGLAAAAAPPRALWTPRPMPMTEPDKEARANVTRIRSGQATLPEVLREQGIDPEEWLEEQKAWNDKLDAAGIWLDSDPRRTSQAGLTQERVGAGGNGKDAAANGADAGEEATDGEGSGASE